MNFWQEEFLIYPGMVVKLTIGALDCYLTVKDNEWVVEYVYQDQDEQDKDRAINLSKIKKVPAHDLQTLRFIQSITDGHMAIKPRLADKSIVTKPSNPIVVPSGESVTVYLSTPVWLGLYRPSSEKPLIELPSFKLSDSWFGPKPHIGELCYATSFSGRMNYENLPQRESRVITPIVIENKSADLLRLEKIAIPCRHLDLYINDNGMLCTQTLRLRKTKDKKTTAIELEHALLDTFKNARRISTARETDHSGFFNRTLDMFFN